MIEYNIMCICIYIYGMVNTIRIWVKSNPPNTSSHAEVLTPTCCHTKELNNSLIQNPCLDPWNLAMFCRHRPRPPRLSRTKEDLYKSRCNLASTRGGDVTITPGATICADERFQSDACLISNVGIKNQNTTDTCRGAALSKEEINMICWSCWQCCFCIKHSHLRGFEQSADLPLKNTAISGICCLLEIPKTTLQTDQEPWQALQKTVLLLLVSTCGVQDRKKNWEQQNKICMLFVMLLAAESQKSKKACISVLFLTSRA